jgi:hypothetical protein
MAAPAVALNTATALPATKPTSWAPTAKVSAGALAGSVTMIATPLMTALFKKVGLEYSPQVGVALTSIITFIVQYMVPERT